MRHPHWGPLTKNRLFAEAASRYKNGTSPAEQVKVYEKIRTGIWVYNGLFELVDCWIERSGGRSVFKFKLRLASKDISDRPPVTAHTVARDFGHEESSFTSVHGAHAPEELGRYWCAELGRLAVISCIFMDPRRAAKLSEEQHAKH